MNALARRKAVAASGFDDVPRPDHNTGAKKWVESQSGPGCQGGGPQRSPDVVPRPSADGKDLEQARRTGPAATGPGHNGHMLIAVAGRLDAAREEHERLLREEIYEADGGDTMHDAGP